MNRKSILAGWSVAVGAMDALTGLLLILNPSLVLWMLGIACPPPGGLVFLSWIGVFVAGVGMSYGFALWDGRRAGETVWKVTALLRMMVCGFLAIRILGGQMVQAWWMVALPDGFVALVQIVILRKGWWKEAEA